MVKLSRCQSVYQFIRDYQISNDGRIPSQDEIASGLGKGRSTIRFHLERLMKKGYIIDSGGHRAIKIVESMPVLSA